VKTKQMELRPFATAPALPLPAPATVGRARVAHAGGRRGRGARPPGMIRGGSATATRLSAAALERAEESLLNALLDVHPNRRRALGRLLDDVTHGEAAFGDSPAACRRPRSLFATDSPASRLRVEELLAAAVIGGHPRRRRSLDRLLDDVAEARAEQQARDAFDAACDNDCDGMG
jgi:hypothetical protein